MVEAVVIGTIACALAVWFWMGRKVEVEVKETPAPNVKVSTLPTEEQLNKLTKAKLEELGREHGVELDRRKTKATMIADLKEAVK